MRIQLSHVSKATLLAALCLLLGVAVPDAQTRAELVLKAAMDKEVIDGDLKGAIEAYQRVVANAGSNRALAAEALMRMADCYRKMGDAESRKVYERIVREYGDQKDAAATARARLNGDASTPGTAVTARRVWAGPNVDTYGGVSPDGRLLSFTDWETGDLAMHEFATGRDRRLTTKKDWNDPAFAEGSAFSPDGRQIAYGWWLISPSVPDAGHFSEVRIVDTTGGTPRVLFGGREHGVDAAYVHEWSRDGRWLVVGLRRTDRTFQIGLISTSNGALRVVASAVDRDGSARGALSPDGRYVAYDRALNEQSEQREIRLAAIDGSRDVAALAHPARDRVLGWSPDGTLLFVSDRSGGHAVWALPTSDGKPAGDPRLLRANVNPSSVGMTGSGALYYGIAASTPDIYVAAADFETGRVLAPPTIIPKPYFGVIAFPQWSPDGESLAYLSRRDPNSRNTRMGSLLIRSLETGDVRELRPDLDFLNFAGTRPLWSRDSTFFLVSAVDRDERQGIYRIDARTGESSPVIVSQPGQRMIVRAFSPDGRTLFFSRIDAVPQQEVLFARTLASGDQRELARRAGGWGRGSDLSPDGKTIAIGAIDRSIGSTTVSLISTESGASRELLRASRPESILGSFYKWSPDGRSILIVKDKGDGSPRELWRVSADDGSARKVDMNADWVQFLGVPGRDATSFHPDGRQVAFVRGESQLEIWALENSQPAPASKR